MNVAKTIAHLAIIVTQACGGSEGSQHGVSGIESSQTNAAASDTLSSEEFDGVWVFWHSSDDHDDAGLRGAAAIVDACLTVGGYVVVWHASRLDEARTAIEEARAGRHVDVRLAGSESLHEPTLTAVHNSCPDFPVWLGF